MKPDKGKFKTKSILLVKELTMTYNFKEVLDVGNNIYGIHNILYYRCR